MIIFKSNSIVHITLDPEYFLWAERSRSGTKYLPGTFSGGDEMAERTTWPPSTRRLRSGIQASTALPWVKNFEKEKEEFSSRKLPHPLPLKIHCLEHSGLILRLGKCGWMDSVVHNSGVCFKSLKVLTQHLKSIPK